MRNISMKLLQFGLVVQKEMLFEELFFFTSGGHLVQGVFNLNIFLFSALIQCSRTIVQF